MSEGATPTGDRVVAPSGAVQTFHQLNEAGEVETPDFVTSADIADVVRGDPGNLIIWGFYGVEFNFPVDFSGRGVQQIDMDFPGGPPGVWPQWIIAGNIQNGGFADWVSWAAVSIGGTTLRFFFTASDTGGGPVVGALNFCFIGRPN